MHLTTKQKRILIIGLTVVCIILISSTLKITGDKKIAENIDNIVIEKISDVSNLPLTILKTEQPKKGLLLFVDEANSYTDALAKKFAGLSYYVAIIDSKRLLSTTDTSNDACLNFAERLSGIAAILQKKYGIDSSNLPILVGKNQGAGIVYAALAQSEKHIFHAGISINFDSNSINTSKTCVVNNFSYTNDQHIEISPAKRLPISWYIFQEKNTVGNSTSTHFIDAVGNAKLTTANEPNTDPISQSMQILQWLDPRLSDQISSDTSDSNLPLIEVTSENDQEITMAIILTGDGGWAEIDKNIAKYLAEKGIPTVALDSLSYFWRTRTPQETADDLDDIISSYTVKWHKINVILIGYSFGADVLPFVANKLSGTNKNKITLIALLGMGSTASFEFHLSSWMNADKNENRLPLLPEIKKMQWANSICIYGIEDEESKCTQTEEFGVKVISMSGDHHFDEKYDLLVQVITENIKTKK